jgi:hypothetical protein
VDVGGAVVADEQTPALVEPGEGAFDDPAIVSEAGAVLGLAPGDHGFDPSLPELPSVTGVVVATVGDDPVGATSRSTDAAAHRWDEVDERNQLGDVVTVTARERPCERRPGAVGQEVVLGARAAPVDRARPGLAAPFFAWIWLESATARDQSSSPAACSSASSNSCSRCQTPASCHNRSRRQHVIPEPNPSSCGKCSHAIPVCNTNKIPLRTLRSSSGLRPG